MPTENRSSNTEMVSVPRDKLQAWQERFSKAQMFQQSTEVQAALAQPAPKPHPEPIAWMIGTAFWWTKEEAERDAAATGKAIVPFGPTVDNSEVERLRAALQFYADREHYHFESGNWDTVSGEPLNILWCGEEPDFIEDGTVARKALSASAEPEAT